MKATEKVANRLALLAGVDLSEAELESIAAELEDLDRIVEELEDFAQGTPWVSHQSQPGGSKA